MGVLDLFTGAASQTAAKNNQAAIAANQQYGGTALTNTSQTALDYLLGKNGVGGAFQYSTGGYDTAKGDVNNAYNQAQGFLGQATSAYQPLVNAGQGTLGTYYDAIGANGADGSARAASAFTASPGYQYGLDQALNAVQRSAASRGGLAGGNATSDILKTANGLASQGYQQYVNNLQGGLGAYTTGVSGMAGSLTNQGNAAQGYGNALSALDVGQGNQQAAILGQGAGVQQGLGQNLANLNNTNTNAITANNNNLAQSQNAAGANILGAFLGGAQLLSGNAGAAAGGAAKAGSSSGGLFGGLRGIFGA